MNFSIFTKDLFKNDDCPYDKTLPVIILTLNIITNMMGSFIFYIPFCFYHTGIVFGTLLAFFAASCSFYTFVLISYISLETKSKGYSDIFIEFSIWLRILVDLSIILLTIVSNSSYVMLISNCFKNIFEVNGIDIPLYAIVLFLTLVILFPLTLGKHLYSQRILSTFGFASMISIFGFLVVSAIRKTTHSIPLLPSNWTKTIYFFPLISGAFDMHTNASNFYVEFKERATKNSLSRYIRLTACAFIIYFVFVVIFSVLYLLVLGPELLPDTMKNIENKAFQAVNAILLTFVLISAFTLFFYSMRLSTQNLIFRIILKSEIKNDLKWRAAICFMLLCPIISISCLAPNINDVLGFFWTIFGTGLVFIYPTAWILAQGNFKWRFLRIINLTVFFFGSLISGLLGIIVFILEKSGVFD